ncbi:MAG: hypothetical protein II984_02375 [Clostridia bacterium]|nr:hypothetical protein [Clostridia bacterium]
MELNKNEYIMYKGLPLVREGDRICYGDLNEKYMLMLNILSEKENGEPDLIMVQIRHTDDKNKIVKDKQAFKNGLFEALDLGVEWLKHIIKEDK